MLDSMIRNPRPTRAEASDVANAIIDGTDAVMLSGETATGEFPIESVRTMARIAEAIEASERRSSHVPHLIIDDDHDIPGAVSAAAHAIVKALPIRAIVTFTMSGNTARLMSQQRPGVPILALTPSETVYRRMNLFWGVTPVWTLDCTDDVYEMNRRVYAALTDCGILRDEEIMIVVVLGTPFSQRMPTNTLQVYKVHPEIDTLPTPVIR
jgi:pyruvate kinase